MKARWGLRRISAFLGLIILYGATVYSVSKSSSIEAQWITLHFLGFISFILAAYACCKPWS